MDLIYADETRKDIGILNSYEFDMAYGESENDFECSIDRNEHCCKQGYFIYVEGEEYGGIIDDIYIDTETEEIKYIGRTWHGILEKKVIQPEKGNDFLLLSGEANSVIQEIIERIGLTNLFEASTEDSEIQINLYQPERYSYAYTEIRKMLKTSHAKLKAVWKNGKVRLSAEPVSDYSQEEEFDTSQVDFQLRKKFRPVNHMICLGQGELKDRAVIHIFTDEHGGIQPYTMQESSEPIKDLDYILDERAKILFEENEVVEVYDSPSAEVTKNYTSLTQKPADWETNCEKYFTYEPEIEFINGEEVDNGGSYKEASAMSTVYHLLKKQPYDWTENFASYFIFDQGLEEYKAAEGTKNYSLLTTKPGSWSESYSEYYTKTGSVYNQVEGIEEVKYITQSKQPSDWKTNYSDYYVYYSDGTIAEYQNVDGETYYTYDRQTMKPTDWQTNYSSYYRPATSKELKKNKSKKWYSVAAVKNKAPAWNAKKYYTKHSHQKAPAWNAKKRYTKLENINPPAWQANKYYMEVGQTPPTWQTGKFYHSSEVKKAPEFIQGKYYEEHEDRFAVMVAEAIEKLKEYHASDELAIDFKETDQVYDVGDIVGTTEQITGIQAIQEVVKKIIKIQNNDITINYEVK